MSELGATPPTPSVEVALERMARALEKELGKVGTELARTSEAAQSVRSDLETHAEYIRRDIGDTKKLIAEGERRQEARIVEVEQRANTRMDGIDERLKQVEADVEHLERALYTRELIRGWARRAGAFLTGKRIAGLLAGTVVVGEITIRLTQ